MIGDEEIPELPDKERLIMVYCRSANRSKQASGKLVKLGAGIMNTHSRNADGRMEVLSACALEACGPTELACRILNCITTDEAVGILQEAGVLPQVMERLCVRIQKHLDRRAGKDVQIGAVVFSNEFGLLGMTEQAQKMERG